MPEDAKTVNGVVPDPVPAVNGIKVGDAADPGLADTYKLVLKFYKGEPAT